MPEWSKEVVLALIAAATGGIAWLFKGWRDDRVRRELTQQTIIEKKDEKIAALYAKVESLLADANAYLRETDQLRAERIVTDKQFAALVTAMIAMKERDEAMLARILKDGR